jgi:hypothetical protein
MWLLVVLFMIVLAIIRFNVEAPLLVEIKTRYWAILDMLTRTRDPLWAPILRPAIITGLHGKIEGVIGSNVNKGYEIYICLDGDDINSAIYVLIHELAHMTVPEYDHSAQFWTNFEKLKTLCIANGLYEKKGTRTYCGETVRD